MINEPNTKIRINYLDWPMNKTFNKYTCGVTFRILRALRAWQRKLSLLYLCILFFQKKTLKTQDFPKLMNYQSKSIFSLTYIIINLCIDFICWNKLTWNTCWRNGTRPRLVASNRRAYRGRRWAPRDAREMWRSMRGEWRLCGVALLPLAACRA